MLRFFTRRQSFIARRKPARPRLSCERLEDRSCPSGFTSFQETQLQGCLVELSGVIDDTEPDADTVQFSGVVAGQTTPAEDGSFSLQAEASGLGDITAEALDATGAVFDTASATVSSDPPSVTFSASYSSSNTVVLTGQVSDAQPSGLEVDFSGAVSGSTTADSAGNFTYTAAVPASGDVQATTTNVWGQTSEPASAWASAPPTVTLATSYSGQSVTLSGQVSDDNPGGLTVNFGGAISGSAVTAADGSFSLETSVAASGDVTAATVDGNGLTSNTASAWASAPPTMTLTTSYSGQSVILSGQVSDDNPGGLTVNFGGAISGSAVTAADGSFSLETSVAASGDVTAATVDGDGLTSNLRRRPGLPRARRP